jgi:hypothetical protein
MSTAIGGPTMMLHVFLVFLLSVAVPQKILVCAFQSRVYPRDYSSTLGLIATEHRFSVQLTTKRIHSDRVPAGPLLVAGNVDDGDDKESLIKRLKTHIKSYQDYNEDAKRTVLRRMEPYVKYPFRRLRNYFQGEKQEEVDAFNDIIVSDEVLENVQAAAELTEVAPIETSPISGIVEVTGIPQSVMEVAPGNVATTTVAPRKIVARSDVSAPDMDLSGEWNIITTEEFKKDYDKYLTLLGQPFIVRSVALSIVGLTTEETVQSDGGRTLFIRGQNARGVWERTLTASTSENPLKTPIVTVDSEKVEAEAWWEDNGRVHKSWLRGVQKYGGGDFESKRYLEGGKVFVCNTIFHPRDQSREKARVTWRFRRQGETLKS